MNWVYGLNPFYKIQDFLFCGENLSATCSLGLVDVLHRRGTDEYMMVRATHLHAWQEHVVWLTYRFTMSVFVDRKLVHSFFCEQGAYVVHPVQNLGHLLTSYSLLSSQLRL